jgi:hypothetical protein
MAPQVVREIEALPLAEDIPIAHNSTRQGRRAVSWRSDKGSQLCWIETQDGGDPKVSEQIEGNGGPRLAR